MRRKKKSRLTTENEDPFSTLPDHILHCVLSELEAKRAAQTCILSKRWRYVWKDLHCLKFIFSDKPKKSVDSFTKYVSLFLKKRDKTANIHAFKLIAPFTIDIKSLKAFIRYTFHHNVKQLSMSSLHSDSHITAFVENRERLNNFEATGLNSICLSRYLSYSGSLKYLKLDSFSGYITLPTKLNLPSLEIVSLQWFKLGNSNADTFSNCPNLRALKLSHCTLAIDLAFLYINAPRLQYLQFFYLHEEIYYLPCQGKILIDAPSLNHFSFRGFTPLKFVIFGRPCLDYFKIELKVASFQDIFKNRFALLLIKLRNAETAEVSLRTLEVLSACRDLLVNSLPPVFSLKSLKLRADWCCKEITPAIKDVLTLLFRKSPNTEIVMEGVEEANVGNTDAEASTLRHQDAVEET